MAHFIGPKEMLAHLKNVHQYTVDVLAQYTQSDIRVLHNCTLSSLKITFYILHLLIKLYNKLCLEARITFPRSRLFQL